MKALFLAAPVLAPTGVPPHIVLRERMLTGTQVCAEYTTATAPRQPNLSCVDASQVRQWILANAKADEACE